MSTGGPEAERRLPPGTVWLLCALSMLPAVSVDIMLPATGQIAAQYGVPEARGGLLVGGFMLGYGVGQVVWGLASDAFGRRPIILASMAAMTLAATACAFAPSFEVLLALRVLHGLSAGAPVVARAATRDLGSGPAMVQLLSLLMATISIGPLFAPVLGSAMLVLFDWRAIFVFLGLAGGVLWLLARASFAETMTNPRPERFSFGFVLRASATLMRERDYVLGGAIIVLTFAGYGSLLSLGAVVTEDVYGVRPEAFGAIFALAAIFNAIGSLSVRQLGRRLGLDGLLALGAAVMAAALAMHVAFLFFVPPLALFWAGVCVYVLSFGLLMSTGTAVALLPAGAMPGFAASLLGLILMTGAFLGGVLATAAYAGDHRAISATMAGFGGAALVVLALRWALRRG